MDDQNKNLLLAIALSMLVILTWTILFPPEVPPPPSEAPVAGTSEGAGPSAGPSAEPLATAPPAVADPTVATLAPGAETTEEETVRRLELETARLSGSVSLLGGRIDDLRLTDYRVRVAPDAPIVTLLSPASERSGYYALHGWAPAGELAPDAVPGARTVWEAPDGATLSPDQPIDLTWDNGAGLRFTKTIAVDDDYLFTVTQSVTNTTDAAVRLYPYGLIARHGIPNDLRNFFVLHEGLIQSADGELNEQHYGDIQDFDTDPLERTPTLKTDVQQNGWIGFTDHYWMTTLMPGAGSAFTAVAKYNPAADIFQTEARLPPMQVAPGETANATTHFFAGAKEWEALSRYQDDLMIARFTDAVDWGWFYFLTKPIFIALHWLKQVMGNMGWAIIGLTLIIKTALLPLAYKSYVSMSKMKELQPEMEKIKERVGDDRMAMQKEMMELYKKEKVNPAAGCLPILLQIPIFFSLYKVIFVTIDLRHAPWFGWIQDLSAPDPSSFLNLFGLLPWGAPDPLSLLGIFSIGVLPILMGVTMWLQQKLNPAPTDPTQAMIFAWMPWIFMFMLGTFAAGLVLYWTVNNVITFLQQYFIMRSQGVKPDIFGNIIAGFKREKKAE